MKTSYDVLLDQKNLFYSLIVIGLIFLVANLLNQENYPLNEMWYPTDILYIIIPAIAIIFGSVISVRYRGKGNHGKAWIFLTLAVTSWYIAENLYVYNNEYEDLTSYTSEIGFLVGYPLFFVFGVYYIKARKKIISKKIILAAYIISIALVIPSLYISFAPEEELETVDVIITALYPILDGVILAPALIGVTLFFKGQVNLLWTLFLFGVLCHVVGDTFYLGSYIDDSYYPGHFSDILFLWGYTMFTYGFYSHLKLYRKETANHIDSFKK